MATGQSSSCRLALWLLLSLLQCSDGGIKALESEDGIDVKTVAWMEHGYWYSNYHINYEDFSRWPYLPCDFKLSRDRTAELFCWMTGSQTRTGIAEQRAKVAAAAAAARDEKLRASAEITVSDGKQPLVIQELKAHNDQCVEDIAGWEGQLAIDNRGLQVMSLILNIGQCSDDSGAPFLQTELKCCKDNNHTTMLLEQFHSSRLSSEFEAEFGGCIVYEESDGMQYEMAEDAGTRGVWV